ncbi:hypothetical protein BIV59_04700 [Bacillus sp. MUM 13]|nr:hypothetical protein BIV59_04700 [Bacillus sp. MUM 13]
MKNSSGYIYLEMLASFFLCVFLAVSILPIMSKIRHDRSDLFMKTEAYHLLYEQLDAYMDGEGQASGSLKSRGHSYILTWRESSVSQGMMEGCITYKKANGREETFCDAAKR